MPQLGFCGLGQMGALMAGRLIDAGHGVAVCSLDYSAVVAHLRGHPAEG